MEGDGMLVPEGRVTSAPAPSMSRVADAMCNSPPPLTVCVPPAIDIDVGSKVELPCAVEA